MINDQDIQKLIQDVQSSRKYRDLELPDEFLKDLISNEIAQSPNKNAIKETFRKKLHEVVAPYLEDINYKKETANLIALNIDTQDINTIRAWARAFMEKHASTRERLPHLEDFYQTIWTRIGYPESILDLACALDPLALPWFNNPRLKSFYAVDIHKPRLNFLNTFFELFFPFAETIQQDFIAEPIHPKTDCVFLFKEAHRMEKRKPGSTRQVIESLNARHIVISLPATDLRGHHDLSDYHTRLIEKAIDGLNVKMSQARSGSELLYFIEKL